MKIRNGFVSNSSSSSFIITNTSKDHKTLVDFVKENPQLLENYRAEYSWSCNDKTHTQEKLIESARQNDMDFPPGFDVHCIFGDEDGTLIGGIFDYILRDGGSSESFRWHFDEFLR